MSYLMIGENKHQPSIFWRLMALAPRDAKKARKNSVERLTLPLPGSRVWLILTCSIARISLVVVILGFDSFPDVINVDRIYQSQNKIENPAAAVILFGGFHRRFYWSTDEAGFS